MATRLFRPLGSELDGAMIDRDEAVKGLSGCETHSDLRACFQNRLYRGLFAALNQLFIDHYFSVILTGESLVDVPW